MGFLKGLGISLGIILGVLFLVSRLPFLSFRQSEAKQTRVLEAEGQETPTFHEYEVAMKDGSLRKMHYTHVGEAGKPLVILVHGSPGGSSGMNDYLMDTVLTQSVQLAAVDRPGYGLSEYGRTERDLENQAKALRPILERHDASKVLLLGHSFGGPIVARMAMDYPDLINGLVIVAGSIAPELEPEEWWRKPADWAIFRWLLPKSLRVCNQEILAVKPELEKMMPLWENISCPVTVFQGVDDNLVPLDNAFFAKKMLVNSSRVDINTVDHGNHFILWTMQQEIANSIRSFFTP